MKSKICILIMVIFFSAITVINFESIASSTANIVVDTKNVVQGNDTEIKINLENNIDFSAGNFKLTYDPTILEYKSYSVGSVLKKTDGSVNGTLLLNQNNPGEIKIGYISDVSQTSETKYAGELLSLTFNVKSGAGTSTHIELQAPTLKKDDGTDVTASITNGEIKIISGIKLNTTSLNLEIGKTSNLSIETLPTSIDISNEKTIWKSANTSIATVNSNGLVTPVAPGKTEIIATVLGLSAKCSINVTSSLQSISLSESTVILDVGDTKKLEVIYNPANTTDSKNVTWNSSNKAVAKVDTNGKITAISPGKTTITANVGNKKVTCTVTVLRLIGDIDKDNNITVNDAYDVLETSVDISLGTNVSEEIFLNSDVDEDGIVTAQDAYNVLEYSVGIKDKF